MKIPSKRTLRKRRKQLLHYLTGTYQFSPQEADTIADRAVEAAERGEAFQTTVDTAMVTGDFMADLTVGVMILASLKGGFLLQA